MSRPARTVVPEPRCDVMDVTAGSAGSPPAGRVHLTTEGTAIHRKARTLAGQLNASSTLRTGC